MTEVIRCRWAQGDALMTAYHDAEWGVPVYDSRLLWEMLMLEGFQAGLSWSIILKRRGGFHTAFAQWDPVNVAAFGPSDIARLMNDPGIIRARAKIEATIGNARAYLAFADRGEDFGAWAWDLAGGTPVIGDGTTVPTKTTTSEAMSKALKARGFKFVGPVIVYAWMQAVGMVNDHSIDCFRRDLVSAPT
ncbi:DNA-3-methyladenine glycosylase I [Sphingomonas suaedae]|uniref:DNA-3-methyladenine glycosylase I n=1 Tax=Sphingomonas suaedae TaxID=2599297 RepID=A0A518RDB7_9SPHN|nr:DNA-3-methyladenine glycosylase I [Sphingomonas suaedae]QDX25450.1 DNA-3-methyladenine glycosylase I [Sphingomonas suaedae]